jgi:hypothetical protein
MKIFEPLELYRTNRKFNLKTWSAPYISSIIFPFCPSAISIILSIRPSVLEVIHEKKPGNDHISFVGS